MASNFMDLTSTKRPSIKLTSDRPAKRRRRSTSSMSTSSCTSSGPSVGPSRNQPSRDMSLAQRTRRVGDGLDFRRPAPTAGSSNNPIDLSSSDDDVDLAILVPPSRPASRPRQPEQPVRRGQPPSRLPRNSQQIMNEVINIDDNDNTGREEHLRHHETAQYRHYPASFHLPSDTHSARQTPHPIHHHNNDQAHSRSASRRLGYQPPNNAPILVIDDDDDDDEDSLIVEDGHGNRMPAFNNDEAAMIRNRLSGRTPVTGVRGAQSHTRAQALLSRVQSMHLRAQTPQPPLPPQRERGLGLASFIQPALDYAAAAFPLRTALGTPNSRYPEPDRRPAPPLAYSALEACADGFTRSPEEGDVLVCPRCDRELCVEEPTPAAQGSSKKNTSSSAKAIKTKQEQGRDEVWIVKACGHAYCGACARARKSATKKSAKSKTSPKGKGKESIPIPLAEPFSNCLVKGCHEKLSSKTHMVQLFL